MSGSPFDRFLDAQGFVVLDGGLGSALEAAGHALGTRLWSGQMVLDDPAGLGAVHLAYLEAGADVIATAGYQLSFEAFEALGYGEDDAVKALRASVTIAVEARDAFWGDGTRHPGRLAPLVAASVGPYGAFLADGSEYDGRYGVGEDVLRRFHQRRLDVLLDTEANVVVYETMPSGPEARVVAALLADRATKPAWLSFTCRDAERLWDGTPIEDAVRLCEGAASIVAVGVNCVHPGHAGELVRRIAEVTDLPVSVCPNSGETYDDALATWRGPSASWLGEADAWIHAGASLVGGCCRLGPDEIRELRRTLSNRFPG